MSRLQEGRGKICKTLVNISIVKFQEWGKYPPNEKKTKHGTGLRKNEKYKVNIVKTSRD